METFPARLRRGGEPVLLCWRGRRGAGRRGGGRTRFKQTSDGCQEHLCAAQVLLSPKRSSTAQTRRKHQHANHIALWPTKQVLTTSLALWTAARKQSPVESKRRTANWAGSSRLAIGTRASGTPGSSPTDRPGVGRSNRANNNFSLISWPTNGGGKLIRLPASRLDSVWARLVGPARKRPPPSRAAQTRAFDCPAPLAALGRSLVLVVLLRH